MKHCVRLHLALRALASDWRLSGIFNARSGNWLTVTTGRDPAGTGISGQRVNQVSDNPASRASCSSGSNTGGSGTARRAPTWRHQQ